MNTNFIANETQSLAAVGSLCSDAHGTKRFQEMVIRPSRGRTACLGADETHAIRVEVAAPIARSVLIPGQAFASLASPRARAVLDGEALSLVMDGVHSACGARLEPSTGSEVASQVQEQLMKAARDDGVTVTMSIVLLRRILAAVERASFPNDTVKIKVPSDPHRPVMFVAETVGSCVVEAIVMPMARRTR